MNFPIEALPPEVRSVIVFGSQARGDADKNSDLDVCLFLEEVPFQRLIEIRHSSSALLGLPVESVTAYPVTVLAAMSRHGSLFLWHLKLEGRVLHDPRGLAATMLGRLEQFASYESELELYGTLLRDVDAAVRQGEGTEFDLHMLFVILRNTAILLTYAEGRPEFGRMSAFRAVAGIWPEFAETQSVYDELCAWHLAYARGVRVEGNTTIRFMHYVRVVQAFLQTAKTKLR